MLPGGKTEHELKASLYDTLSPTAAITDYAIGL